MYKVFYVKTNKFEVMDRERLLTVFPQVSSHFLALNASVKISLRDKINGTVIISPC